ncbi:MAG TPA: ABC transporter permease [Vicinamibacterales bacterium]|nr:ABC transporter permease [Vicinamibacterales bacterium]
MFETIWQDLRHGARMLVKNPGFALIGVMSIAIGVGANAAMFSIADGLVLRPLPVPAPNGVLSIAATTPTGELRIGGISYPDYTDLRSRSRSFDDLAAADGLIISFARHRDEPARGTWGAAVSANFFDVLRVRPALGRTFAREEDRVPGRDAVVVLGHHAWTEQFGADPGIVGREIRLSGRVFTIIGVAPEEFTGLGLYLSPAFYVPMAMLPVLNPDAMDRILEQRDFRTLQVVGRLRSNVSLAQARQEVERISRDLQREFPATNERHGLLVRTQMQARFDENPQIAGFSLILIGMALAVLLVACANVAGLLTSRAPLRAREVAVRLAIGGSRVRLVRQLITECALLAVAGGAAGLAVGYGIIRLFEQFQIVTDIGVKFTYVLDQRALTVGVTIAAVSALLSSIVPAWRTTRAGDLSGTLRNTTAPATKGARLWGRHGLVAVQIALTLAVLTAALSFYRAFQAEYGNGTGFRTDHVLLTSLDPGLARYDQQQSDSFYRLLKERVASRPGVTSVALTSFVPLTQDGGDRATIVPEGFVLPPGVDDITVAAARIDEGYFTSIGIPMLAGRGFLNTDTADAPRVAIVSRGMASRYWPDENPIGKRLRLVGSDATWAEVVGVASDVKIRLFASRSTPILYLPRLQNPITRSTLIVRTAIESAAAAADVRAAILETDRNVPILGMETMEAFYHGNAKNLNTVVVRTIGTMGTMGLVLALVGLYGLAAYSVSRRTREIGIRMAMGALPESVLRMVLRQSSVPAISGIVSGVVASFLAGRTMQSIIPNTAADTVTYLLIVPAVVMVLMLAAYIPARRAAHIDPLRALRQD